LNVTPLSPPRNQVFSTAADNQPAVDIVVLQGERAMSQDNKTLGTFKLDGIRPAPRGTPQIEVTFDIDANGILNVTAKDKDTGKDQKITISGSSSMDEQEVERLKKEAEKFAEQDKEKKDSVQVRNELDSLVYQCEKQLTDLGDKAPDDLKTKIGDMLADAKKVLDDQSSTPSSLKEAKQKLEKGFEELAKQAAQAGGGADPAAAAAAAAAEKSSGGKKSKEDDIVDADFEVVEDEKDEKKDS